MILVELKKKKQTKKKTERAESEFRDRLQKTSTMLQSLVIDLNM